MTILEELVVNKKLPIHEEYKGLLTKIHFWRATHEMDVDYIDGLDARGAKILPPHTCEAEDKYLYRKKITKPKNYAGSIINQYHSYLYRNEVDRTLPEDLAEDADLYGNSWDEIMKDVALDAQIAGRAYIIPNTTAPAEPLTEAQAAAGNIRAFIETVPREAVVHWGRKNGVLEWCIILYDGFARYWDSEIYIDMEVEMNNRNSLRIKSVTEPQAHNYGQMPVVEVYPKLWKSSQIAKLAELQQTIINLESTLMVELMGKTFSHHVFSGDFDIPEGKTISIGQGEATILETHGGVTPTIQVLGGADVAQADSLRKSIAENIAEIYRTAALSSPEPLKTMAPESGAAKSVENIKTEATVKSIADAMERAENKTLQLLGVPGSVDYPDQFMEEEEEQAETDTI